MNDIYTLIINNKFTDLSDSEREFVLNEITEEGYTRCRKILNSTKRAHQEDYKKLVIDPDIKKNLKVAFAEKFDRSVLEQSQSRHKDRNISFYKRYKVFEAASFILILLLAYFGKEVIQNKNQEVHSSQINFEALGLEEMEEMLINVEMCLDAELIMPDIYAVHSTHDLVNMDFSSQ